MKCLYGNWFDGWNGLHVDRQSLVAHAFFYEQLVDNFAALPALRFVASVAQEYRRKGRVPMPDDDLVDDWLAIRHVLEYLISEAKSAAGRTHAERLSRFVYQGINEQGRIFFDSEFQDKYEHTEWKELPEYFRTGVRVDFKGLVEKFILFAESIGEIDNYLNQLGQAALFEKAGVLVDYDKAMIDRERRAETRRLVDESEAKRGTARRGLRLMTLAIAYEIHAHYACTKPGKTPGGLPVAPVTTVTYPSTSRLTVRDLMHIRRTREWKDMTSLFEAHHCEPTDGRVAADFNSSLRGLTALLKRRERESLIGSALAAASTIPGIGVALSGLQSIAGFLQYLTARKTVLVTRRVGHE